MNTLRIGLLVCVAAVALLLPSFTLGQEGAPPSQFERVKALAPFRGVWASEVGGGGSAPEFRMLSNWTANRSYMQMQFTSNVGDERTHLGTVTIGWNGADSALTSWAFWPDYQSKGSVSIDGETMHVKAKGVTVDGKEMSADVTMSVDGDNLNIKVANGRRGDEAQPDLDVTLKRSERRRRRAGQ